MTTTDPAVVDIDEVIRRFADLPTLAPVAMEVIRLADDERASMADLAAAISVDPGLTARLLRLANSANYGQQREVTNLDRATALLGLRTVKLLSLGFTLVANMNDGPIDTSKVWRRSLASSVLARRLANDIDRRQADDAFVAGLLSNIGKLALASEPVYVDAFNNGGPWMSTADEIELLGFASDEVTSRILTAWGLPELLSNVIGTRSEPAVDGHDGQLASILQVADAMAVLLLVETDEEKARALEATRIAAAGSLGMTMPQIKAIIDEMTGELDEIAAMFELEAITSTPITDIILSAQEHLARISLDIASTLNQEQQRNEALTQDNERLATQASTDGLTGLPNRRTFDAYLTNQIGGRLRNPRNTSLALIIFDLDFFKKVNDDFGHAVGDDVLRAVAERIDGGTRRSELSARIGGEEFAVVLPDTSPIELEKAAERFRALIGTEPVETGMGPLSVTASVGAAHTTVVDEDTATTLFTTADQALYESKEGGRNQVTMKSL